MREIEPYVSPTREELAQWDEKTAHRIDNVNREIFRRNKMVVARVKQILLEAAPQVGAVRDLEAPAIPIEYARKHRELIERDAERD